MMNMNRLSNNFVFSEFTRSDTAKRLNIDNNPKDFDLIFKRIYFLTTTILQPVRDKFGPIRILSGYRCLELNRALKSSDYSNHVFGYAADIEPINNVPLIDIIEYIAKNFEFDEVIAEYFPNGWVHVAAKMDADNRHIIKLKDSNHNYDIIDIEELKKIY